MKIKTIDYYWWRRLGSILYQRASSRLFIPRGDDVFSWCIKWTSLAFLTVAAYEFNWNKKNVKPKYWANLFKQLFFVLFFGLLLHGLSVLLMIFYKYYCTDLGLQLGDPHHSTVCRCGLVDILYTSILCLLWWPVCKVSSPSRLLVPFDKDTPGTRNFSCAQDLSAADTETSSRTRRKKTLVSRVTKTYINYSSWSERQIRTFMGTTSLFKWIFQPCLWFSFRLSQCACEIVGKCPCDRGGEGNVDTTGWPKRSF